MPVGVRANATPTEDLLTRHVFHEAGIRVSVPAAFLQRPRLIAVINLMMLVIEHASTAGGIHPNARQEPPGILLAMRLASIEAGTHPSVIPTVALPMLRVWIVRGVRLSAHQQFPIQGAQIHIGVLISKATSRVSHAVGLPRNVSSGHLRTRPDMPLA